MRARRARSRAASWEWEEEKSGMRPALGFRGVWVGWGVEWERDEGGREEEEWEREVVRRLKGLGAVGRAVVVDAV